MGLFDKFTGDDRAVSPVIGVVLMVAVVVILAAVIGAFVLGLGGDQSAAPQATFSVNNAGEIIYEGGDAINGDDIEAGGVATDSTSSGELTAGDPVGTIPDDASGTARVIYTGDGGSTTIWSTQVGGGGAADGA